MKMFHVSIIIPVLLCVANCAGQYTKNGIQVGRFIYVPPPNIKKEMIEDEKYSPKPINGNKRAFRVYVDSCINFDAYYRENPDTGLMWPPLDTSIQPIKEFNWKCPINKVNARFYWMFDFSEGYTAFFVSFFDDLGERERITFVFACIGYDPSKAVPKSIKNFIMSQ